MKAAFDEKRDSQNNNRFVMTYVCSVSSDLIGWVSRTEGIPRRVTIFLSFIFNLFFSIYFTLMRSFFFFTSLVVFESHTRI